MREMRERRERRKERKENVLEHAGMACEALSGMADAGSSGPPYDIRVRTFQFACSIVSFHRGLRGAERTVRALADQLLHSATSIGANMEEAKAASSRRDFAAKTAIALREARESLYWLRLIRQCQLISSADLDGLASEADELVAILTTIVRRARTTLLMSVASRGFVLIALLALLLAI